MTFKSNNNGSEIDSGGKSEVKVSPMKDSIEPPKRNTTADEDSINPNERRFG